MFTQNCKSYGDFNQKWWCFLDESAGGWWLSEDIMRMHPLDSYWPSKQKGLYKPRTEDGLHMLVSRGFSVEVNELWLFSLFIIWGSCSLTGATTGTVHLGPIWKPFNSGDFTNGPEQGSSKGCFRVLLIIYCWRWQHLGIVGPTGLYILTRWAQSDDFKHSSNASANC